MSSNQIIQLKSGNKALGIVPTTVEEVFRLATAVARSGLAPRGMDTQEKLTVAIMTGLELGLPPMFAIAKIAVVNGRATLWGDAIPALLWSAGFKIREWMEHHGTDQDKRVAHCEVTRPSGESITRTFSVADARKAGLWGKQGPWAQYPDRMLAMRARGFAARDGAPDVLGGLYMKEEVEDIEATATTVARRSAHAVRKSGEYEKFESEIRACATEADIDNTFARWASLMTTWPESFVANAHGFAEAIKMQLGTPNQEPASPDEPIADVAGYLDKLREERGWCESENDVNELHAANAEMIARLSTTDQAKAMAIINGDDA